MTVNMLSVYELPGYNNQVEQAIGKCHPAFKKKVELKNKIARCTNKKKYNKLLKEYKKLKSQLLRDFYNGELVVNKRCVWITKQKLLREIEAQKFYSRTKIIFQKDN